MAVKKGSAFGILGGVSGIVKAMPNYPIICSRNIGIANIDGASAESRCLACIKFTIAVSIESKSLLPSLRT
jgi:hypothetical protein